MNQRINENCKTIHIYLPDGNPLGIKICDIDASIVKSIYIPRKKLSESDEIEELNAPGVYFLIGDKDEIGKPQVYIGEAENLLGRLRQQNKEKDFWNVAIAVMSVKNNINKAHIKFLENWCCEKAGEINKCNLQNANTPTRSTLSTPEKGLAYSFFKDLKILISALGYPIFDETERDKKDIFICKGKESYAEGRYTEDGFIVFKNSKSVIEEVPSIQSNWTNFRKSLVDKKIMKEVNGIYVFQEDYTFSSPSAAAAVILARSANGWTAWKDKEGKSLDDRVRKTK